MSLAATAGGPFLALAFSLSPALLAQEPPKPAEEAKPAGAGAAASPVEKEPGQIPVLEVGPQGPVSIPVAPAGKEGVDEVTIVCELRYFKPFDAVAALKEVLGQRGSGPVPSFFGPDFRAAEVPSSRVILSGRSRVVDQAVRLLRLLDRATPAPARERTVAVYDLEHADARSVADIIKVIARGESGPPTKVLTDGRTNKVIVETCSAQDLKDIEMLIKELDVAIEVRPIPMATRIVLLKVARAEEVASLIQALRGSDVAPPGRPPLPRRAPSSVSRSDVRVVVDGRMNSLIIEAPPDEMAAVVDLIEKLDVPSRPASEAVELPGEKAPAEPPRPGKAERAK